MLETEPFVSIVTPFYNTDKYLSECIESVLAQTHQNWEYILVNNCSTDCSAEIAQRYLAKDRRIRLINNNNFLTQVQNYNHALRQIASDSKYCKIVQADDWIFPECISSMVKAASFNSSVGIVGAYRLYGRRISNVGLPWDRKVIPGKDLCRMQLMDDYHFVGSPTSVLFRSEIIKSRDPFYKEDRFFEDIEACYDILQSWDFSFVHQVLMFERSDNESISSQVRNFDPDYLLDKFINLNIYGPVYLNPIEYSDIFRKNRDRYFGFLAKNLISHSDNKFWDYHKNGLATINYRFKKSELTIYVILELSDVLFNLKKTANRLLNKFKRIR
jgi:glycosyltransferase involved in cell wall biosynthesis